MHLEGDPLQAYADEDSVNSKDFSAGLLQSVAEERMYWYAIKSKPRQERMAALTLRQAGITTFHPEMKESKVVRGKRQNCLSPLFPGYLFARFNVERDHRMVMYARGVQRIVAFGGVPAVVDEDLIRAIQDRLEGGYVTIQESIFRPGQIVRIEHGPLRGIEAIFQRQIPGYQRAVLLLRAISYQAKLVVDLEQIVNL